jgi:hypothetical protein
MREGRASCGRAGVGFGRIARRAERRQNIGNGFTSPARAALSLFEARPGGISGGGGLGTARTIRRSGVFETFGRGRFARVVAIVPDGVASVRFVFPRRVRGFGRHAHVFPGRVVRTARVHDNVAALRVHRNPVLALTNREVWFDASGRRLRVVRNGGFDDISVGLPAR